MNKIAKMAAVGLVSTMLLSGVALASSGSVDTTGPGSDNGITNNNNQNTNQENNNHVGVDNGSDQNCQSGSAGVEGNTGAGGAQSGEASCDNTTSTIIKISNGGALTPGKGGGAPEENILATTPVASISAVPTTLPATGSETDWIIPAALGSLALVAMKVSSDVVREKSLV